MIRFRTLSIVSSIISFLLFITLLLAPQLVFMLFEVEGNASAYFLARRAAMLFLGYAVIACVIRNAEHSNARQAVILGIGTAQLGLLVLGAFELVRGFAGLGILLAMVVELLLAVACFSLWFSNRSEGFVS